jgi:oligopeptide/dipeptide ABC transporter ATP-binding protein
MSGECLAEMKPGAMSKLLADELAVVFQDPMSALNPALRIGTQMTMATQTHRKLKPKAVLELAVQRLLEVHIPGPERQLRRKPHEFSGGMRQRVTIATGLMGEPAVLIADEPTTALDVTVQAQIMDLLEEINTRRGTAILFISHNLALISQVCDRVLVMYNGRIVEDLRTDQLRTDARHPYTRALLGAVPAMGQPHQSLANIPGEVPEAGNPPTGCSFHPRCAMAQDLCAVERPPLVRSADDDGRQVACHFAHDERPVFVEVGR